MDPERACFRVSLDPCPRAARGSPVAATLQFLPLDHGAAVADAAAMLIESPANPITGAIIGSAIEVHCGLGPGLLESIYLPCLLFELKARGLRFEVERRIPVTYKGTNFPQCYRIDLIVENQVVVELKGVDRVLGVHEAQVLTYLALTGCPLGLLINFNVPKLIDGVTRLVNPRGRTQGKEAGAPRAARLDQEKP